MGVEGINRKNPMKPLPVRVTPQQYDRLAETRRRTGLAIQEHVRRALDLYLDKVEREARASQPPPSADTPTPGKPFAGISTAHLPPRPDNSTVSASAPPVLRSR